MTAANVRNDCGARLRDVVGARGVDGVSIALCVAGVPVTVRGDAELVEELEGRFGGRAVGLTELLPEDRDMRVSVEAGVATLRQRDRVGRIDLSTASVESPSNIVFADALVRGAVAWQLAERGAILLHASAVRTPAGAIVFFGRSGVGKSTVARGLGNALSDELVVLERTPSGWDAVGTPWWRGSRERAPLSKIVWLVRGEPSSVRLASGGELFRAMASEAGRYFPDGEFQRRIFEACGEIARRPVLRIAAGEGRVLEDVKEALA